MWLAIVTLALGAAALAWSADRFTYGAAALARRLGISRGAIGLTVVSLGTSAPEILVSATAAFTGVSQLAVGNAIGSNIANVALVLGATALLVPVPIERQAMRRDFPTYLGVLVLTFAVLQDYHLSRVDGVVLLLALACLMLALVRRHRQHASQASVEPDPVEAELGTSVDQAGLASAAGWLVLGLGVLLLSSRALVWAAIELALLAGVSELVIGLSVVALGTSLPELAATLASALKRHHDLAMGNIIGSNILNLLAVLPVAALIHPTPLSSDTMARDFAVLVGTTGMLALFAYTVGERGKISRTEGLLFLGVYVGYLVWLYRVGETVVGA